MKRSVALGKLQAAIARQGQADAYITWNDEDKPGGNPYTGCYKVFDIRMEGELAGMDCKEYSGIETFICFRDVVDIVPC